MTAADLSRIAMSPSLGSALARAGEFARREGHIEVTLEHMLLSLCEDAEAGLVLASSNIDAARLKSDVAGFLANLPKRGLPGQSGEPGVSPDLRRILEAAAAAARGGRRRDINGAIVLAAIVGDGRSPAAQMLQAQGLTFEGAIRALQRSAVAAAAPPPSSNTEDLLASARERVLSRTAHVGRNAPVPPEPAEKKVAAQPAAAEAEPQPSKVASQAVPVPAPEASEIAPAKEPAPAVAPPPPAVKAAPPPPPPAPPPQPTPAPTPTPEPAPVVEKPAAAPPPPAEPVPPATPPRPPGPPPIPGAAPPPAWGPPPHEGLPSAAPPPPPARPAHAVPSMTPPPIPPPIPQVTGGAVPPPMPGQWAEAPHRPMGVGGGGTGGRGRLGELLAEKRAAPGMPYPEAAGRPALKQRAEIGQLVENIPRNMRVAIPVPVEVRIAKAKIKALAEGLQGGGAAYHHEVTITKAMSVRLRAPDGGFFIETTSPETQWIERAMLISNEDYASWRWHVTPREKGKKRLQLVISARTIGADGLAAETALPDQIITVRVRTNYARTASHLFGWAVAALVGGLIARFGEGLLDMGMSVVAKLTAG